MKVARTGRGNPSQGDHQGSDPHREIIHKETIYRETIHREVRRSGRKRSNLFTRKSPDDLLTVDLPVNPDMPLLIS
jgi:hypothetical protein